MIRLVRGLQPVHKVCSYAKSSRLEIANGFEKNWRTMSDVQKAPIIKEYTALEAEDWHTLSLEQKRASTVRLIINNLFLVYTIAYGPPPVVDPYHTRKVVGGVVAVLAAALGLFALVRAGGMATIITHHPISGLICS